ncbi:hypothetical protein SAMN05443633_103198 [Chryseobacterium arachidis]|uniref:Uncharacterized protein n=1 Tax=Chryseobacterium arachidis TaxID=1416778 RepID=A0A1M4ZL62_9FLAO|nr:hypothetical protein [Chryseobacterium arachidis]SHF18799.1 hypothetical protein SAMN05443633_103198 [Chryseobacterium arachidis]
MAKFFSFFVICFFISSTLYGQNTTLDNKEIYFSKEYKSLSGHEDYDTKTVQSVKFSQEFKKFISENPETFAYDFNKLKENIYIITSEDKKLRFYVWDTELGGTMKSFDQIIQYSSNGKVKTIYSKEQSDTPYFISEIVKKEINQQNYYLVISNGIFSTKDQAQAVQAYTIRNGQLIDSDKIFKTKTTTLNKIQVDFDFFSVVDRPERPFKLIKFDQNKLYIPIVDEQGAVSKKFLIYQLNNNYFQYIGIK